jgi:hypothetical protein
MFIQEKINKIEENKEFYIVNDKYIIYKNKMDSFFKETEKQKKQLCYIRQYLKQDDIFLN